jgi:RNA methyltransferase, TrmH family
LLSKAQIKDIKALQNAKFRQMYKQFCAEGHKVCHEFISHRRFKITAIYHTHDYEDVHALPMDLQNITMSTSNKEMEQMSGLYTPSKILMVMEMPVDQPIHTYTKPQKAIYLEDVQDPGNVGTIIRIADWYGIDTIIRSEGTADYYNPKVIQATMGSINNIQAITATIDEICSLKIPIIGTSLNGKDITQYTIPQSAILAMGSEGRGLKPLTISKLNDNIQIPGHPNRIADSLNVAIATGIVCSRWI